MVLIFRPTVLYRALPNSLHVLPGTPPAVALFATKARYKRESYRGSEFAPRILADNGIRVILKVRVLSIG